MHFQNIIPDSSTSHDYNRLIELCGSYGLNEQETNQIISDFKNGSFALPDQSIDQSFQDSIKNIENNQYSDRNSAEEYSFKHNKNIKFKGMTFDNDSLEHDEVEHSKLDTKSQGQSVHEEMISCFFKERREFEQNIVNKLEEENEFFKKAIYEKEQQIEMFIKMKAQDSDTISGLKNSILSISNVLNEKDRAYRLLLEKYESLKLESESLSTQKSSKVHVISHQESLSSIEERKSIQKEHCLTEVDQNRSSLVKKQSQKQLKDTHRISNNKNFNDENLRGSLIKNEAVKRNGVDINKYKGMIEKLRNSYEVR